MNTSAMCISCIINKAGKRIQEYSDTQKNNQYMRQVLKLLYDYAENKSTAWISTKATELFEELYEKKENFTEIKHIYNQLMLSKEELVEKRIRQSQQPLLTGILYACAGNYIDFGAMATVDDTVLMEILDKVDVQSLSKEVFEKFSEELAHTRELVYLTDNCGEIVMDKLLIKLLKEIYPHLHITVILRGKDVVNDATIEDAREIGLTEVAKCIGNGTAYPGTILDEISSEARELLDQADLIIAKGQGNFESLYGEGLNPYYMFLCKCDYFVQRFELEKFSPVVIKEEDLKS